MSAVHTNDVCVATLRPDVPGSIIGGGGFFAWPDDRPPTWSAVRLPLWLAEIMTMQWVLAALVMAVFVADACAPLGVAMWLLYAVPLVLSHRTPRVSQAYALAAASSVLLFLALFLAPPGFSWLVEAFNRATFACVLWLAAAWIVRHRTAEEALKQSEARSLQLNESLEQRVRTRTSQLETANQELEAFACSVSHDLRAPLRAVDGFARILEEEHAAQLDDQGRRVLGIVRSETHRMGRLINDLLDFSRLGKHDMRLADADMTSLVREQFEQVKDRLADRQVDFRLGDLPVSRADPALLRQVWFNLLDNALKYSQHRRRVEIRIEGTRQGSEVVYSIRDNGAGFDMQYAGKLFGAFQRLHGAEEFEGTGVGLALVKRIIRRHGGRVWAEAKVERGATFYFTLPAAGNGTG